jgi:small subunit ribosomal protein S1
VDLPDKDDLDESLEAEIAAALGDEAAAAVGVAAAASTAAVSAEGQAAAPSSDEPEEIGPGSKITGAVQHVHGDDIFINAGLRSDVVISSKQFPEDKQPSVGDSLTVIIETIDDDGLFRSRLPTARTKTGGNWDGLAVGQVVDCMVTGTNKGGLQVTVSNLKAFLPASQVDVGFVANLEQYVGQKMTVQITEVKPKKRNLVVSRRALIEAERKEQQAGFWESLEVGQDYDGTVKTLKN